MMDTFVRSMQVFVATVESGTMAAAARQLDLSSSAISQQIQKLEQQLNISLLHRNTRKLTLTEAGQLYYQSCKETIGTWQHTEQQLSELRQNPQGELRIAAPVGFAACGLLSAPLQELLHSHQQLNIRLFMQDDEFDLIANRIDLALCVRTSPMPDSNLIARQLAEWDMILAASPAYLAEKGFSDAQMPQNPAELSSLDWLQHANSKAADLVLQTNTDKNTDKASITAKVKLQLNNMQALIQFTRDGLGIAILPKPEVVAELRQGDLCQLLPHWQLPKLQIYAVTGTRDSQPAKVRTAIDILTKALQAYRGNIQKPSP